MRRILIIFLVMIMMVNCQSKKEFKRSELETIIRFTTEDIPPPTQLNGRKLNFQEFLNPRHILFLDNHLVVAQNANLETDLFYLYDLENDSFIGSIGKKGFGPGEMVQSTGMEPGFSEGEFFTFDGNRRTLNFYNIHGADTTKLTQKQLKTPTNLNFTTQISLTSPSSYLVKTAQTWDKLAEINLEEDTLKTIGTWNNMVENEKLSPLTVSLICQGPLTTSNDKTLVGITGVLKDFFEIFNIHTVKRLYIQGPVNQDPKFQLHHYNKTTYPVFDDPLTTYYTQLYLQEEYFFALYVGQNTDSDDALTSNPQLFQFDYEGNFINNFQLDYPILSFSMDSKNGILYGITRDQNPNVAIFDLSKHLSL
ncbi:hypothetical protein DN752_14540 [Echinicola strongylocentroti]|uniref:6-bladed beta-propeller n=1 Tax=Echinicola strongylocentroti TaxID=1795355 RepID=A0A2Z4ILH9_9BACT|nr:BF3164 family lipoprotein [Echinicola strongylocentroti]AWW31243.1 hypothetical protein DN752_14540 [Echinicola strongylocentroti]